MSRLEQKKGASIAITPILGLYSSKILDLTFSFEMYCLLLVIVVALSFVLCLPGRNIGLGDEINNLHVPGGVTMENSLRGWQPML